MNEQLPNNVVRWRDILVEDDSGNVISPPAGDVFSVVSNNPNSLGAVIGTNPASGNPAVGYNALVENSPGVSFTVSDSAGDHAFSMTLDIVPAAPPPGNLALGPTPDDVPQPVPTNPGP
jgi:hypothetical protein